jgi:CRISPR/Cas system-associated exonuclease Cas4 (RecB family)
MYKLNELEDIKLETVQENGKRFYVGVDDVKYPSVTTVTSLLSRDSIMKWRKRVGEEEANRVSTYASNRGTHFHLRVEEYLRGEDINYRNPIEQGMLMCMKDALDRLTPVALEAPLYSHTLRMAGRVDCVAYVGDKLYIVDFKSSGKHKKKEWAKSWFIQMTSYAIMVEELTGHPVDGIMALVAVEDGTFQCFMENPENYVDDLFALRERYKEENGI